MKWSQSDVFEIFVNHDSNSSSNCVSYVFRIASAHICQHVQSIVFDSIRNIVDLNSNSSFDNRVYP